MANPPPFLSTGQSLGLDAPSSPAPAAKDNSMTNAEQLVLDLCNPELREKALLVLSKKRENFPDLALLLWHSFGTMSALLQEIVSVYGPLSRATLSSGQSNRVCNALALLQGIASHPETRMPFIDANIPLYLFPFLSSRYNTKPFEYLRLTSLGVIGALVKVDDPEVVAFLLSNEIIPLCLRSIDYGSELSQTVATYILQKILLDDTGFSYICDTSGRLFAIATVLAEMLEALVERPSPRLLKHIIRCYLRLTDDQRACKALSTHLPIVLRDGTFNGLLENDPITKPWLHELLHKITMANGGGSPHAGLSRTMGM
ncbi:hypothetical protein U9M48_010772 [Paspalum notatum var. saurae]|uniref:Cell differentiation protein rcd1 n=1 Tax=Paspalum notatum var. saurae TaxID=547442 RepID=A0AAQ3WGV1_PASNO